MAYSTIAMELYSQLGEMPSAVAVPVSNGTTLVGIYEGFKDLVIELERIGIVTSMPALIAVSSKDLNPIVRSLRDNLAVYTAYDSSHIDNRETAINEPLINWNSLDGAKTFDAVKESGGWAKWVTDEELASMARLLKNVNGIDPIPAAVASICGLESSAADFSNEVGPIVAVLTGVQPWTPDTNEQ
jgi:threonine synthase